VSHDDVLVLVYTGSYASALALRERLNTSGIRSSFDDLPLSSHGQPDTRIFVALSDVRRAQTVIADFRANTPLNP
jgi:hypothetical protein